MITTHALTVEMAAINRIVNAAMTAIHNEHVQRVSRVDNFSDRRRFVKGQIFWLEWDCIYPS